MLLFQHNSQVNNKFQQVCLLNHKVNSNYSLSQLVLVKRENKMQHREIVFNFKIPDNGIRLLLVQVNLQFLSNLQVKA
jgi:hypothetical protein